MTGNMVTAFGYLGHLRQSLAGTERRFMFFTLLWKGLCENACALGRGKQPSVPLVVICSHSVTDWGVGCFVFCFCSR